MNPFPLVTAELRRNRAGAAAVVALIAIAVALGVAVSAQERALRGASARAADRFDLVIGAPGSPTQLILTTVYLQPAALDLLPASVAEKVALLPGVAALAPVAVADSFAGLPVVGTTADFATDGGRVAVVQGRRFARPDEALVGSAVDLAIGAELRPMHGSPSENLLAPHEHAATFVVVGRLAPTGTPWDRAVLVPIEGLRAMHEGRSTADSARPAASASSREARWGPVPALVVKPVSVADAYALRKALRGHDTTAVFPAEVLHPLYALLGNVGDVVAGLSFTLDVLLLAAVPLIVVATLAARRQSIGALRALGAPPAFIFGTVWLYSTTLIAAGVASGFLGGALLGAVLGRYLSERFGFVIAAGPGWREAALVAALLAAGSLLATLPALATYRSPVRRLLTS